MTESELLQARGKRVTLRPGPSEFFRRGGYWGITRWRVTGSEPVTVTVTGGGVIGTHQVMVEASNGQAYALDSVSIGAAPAETGGAE